MPGAMGLESLGLESLGLECMGLECMGLECMGMDSMSLEPGGLEFMGPGGGGWARLMGPSTPKIKRSRPGFEPGLKWLGVRCINH